MKRPLLILSFLLAPTLAQPQDQPVVTVELQENTTIVGQPLIVRIKVLVPTFSPSPPEFPSMEVPGVVVRLPERASGPVSESVNGETWSGVQRSYRLYPLQPGTFEIAAQSVRVTYAEPGGIDPIVVELDTESIRFEATVPEGAEGLSPLIVANGFTLTQTLEPPGTLEVGGAIERRIEATISGTTPILIPQLLSSDPSETLRVYPKEPRVSETEDRGILSGSRIDAATYLAAAPGAAQLPPVEFDWFNLESGTVETARVDGASFEVTGSANAHEDSEIHPGTLGALLFGTLLLVFWVWRLSPRIAKVQATMTERWKASEGFAASEVRRAIKDRDLSRTLAALDTWATHYPGLRPQELDTALRDVGATRFSNSPVSEAGSAWSHLLAAFASTRRMAQSNRRQAEGNRALPAINPME